MASSKRPPLELDDLTNNLKQSSGRGVDAFFSPQSVPQEEGKQVIHEVQDEKDSHEETQHPVPPVPVVPPKRVMKERWPVNIYHDQYQSLRQLADEDRRQGGMGSMSAMVREAIDKMIAERRQKE